MKLQRTEPGTRQLLKIFDLAHRLTHRAHRIILGALRFHVFGERRAVRLVPVAPGLVREPWLAARYLGEHVFLPHVRECPIELPSVVEPLAALQHCSPEPPLGEGYYFTKGTVTRNLLSLAPSSAYIPPDIFGLRSACVLTDRGRLAHTPRFEETHSRSTTRISMMPCRASGSNATVAGKPWASSTVENFTSGRKRQSE